MSECFEALCGLHQGAPCSMLLFLIFINDLLRLMEKDIAEVKIVENFNTEEPLIFEELESEHTISIVNKYIQESTTDLEKSKINKIFEEVYKEACEMI